MITLKHIGVWFTLTYIKSIDLWSQPFRLLSMQGCWVSWSLAFCFLQRASGCCKKLHFWFDFWHFDRLISIVAVYLGKFTVVLRFTFSYLWVMKGFLSSSKLCIVGICRYEEDFSIWALPLGWWWGSHRLVVSIVSSWWNFFFYCIFSE